MAYKENYEQVISGTVSKNSRGEYIQVARIVTEGNKKDSIDIRLYYTNDDNEIKPTQRGVRINSDILTDVVAYILKACNKEELEKIKEVYLGMM